MRDHSRPAFRSGFTLIEILLVLGLMAVILAGLSATIRMFSRHYTANERRVGRAQLARSISQMLSDDLGAAVQDPIQSVANDPTRMYVRHFGLRGDSRSLQIDVVQPNVFASVADVEENRRVAAGGDKSVGSRQAPELKTIFYEFVPINALLNPPPEVDSLAPTQSAESSSGELPESILTGSLGGASPDENAALTGVLFWDGFQPLVQKYGLSRRELDYETPDEDEEETSASADPYASLTNPESTEAESRLAGSLTAPPDAAGSTLTGDLAQTETETETNLSELVPMTAPQIAMDSDDGTTWAPEVLDCRFSYFDGTVWLDSWDSLEKNGLPVAIKAELKLAPLDDVDLYRSSPAMLRLPLAPGIETISRVISSATSSNGLGGSLTETETPHPVDVFNSYRTPAGYLAAYYGTTRETNASPFDAKQSSNGLAETSEQDPLAGEGEMPTESLLAGGLNSEPGAENAESSNSESGNGSASGGFMQDAVELTKSGAIYNEAGVVVDFANDGTYLTLETMAAELGISEPSVYEVVSYLPTTPYSRAKTIERRQPANVVRTNVNARPGAADRARNRRDQGINPYATGTGRAPRERTVVERTPRERTRNERAPAERNAAERTAANRTAVDRPPRERRTGEERQVNARAGRERTVNERAERTRFANIPQSDGTAYGSQRTQTGAQTERAPGLDPFETPAATPALGGNSGASATGGAAAITGLDPFAVVEQEIGSVPYSDPAASFSAVDSALGSTTPGLVQSDSGFSTVVTPDPSVPAQPSTPQGQQQTWIRGKKK